MRRRTKRGITVADVMRVFAGARVLSNEEAKALRDGAVSMPAPQQQLRLILAARAESE
jgi:hypothetical protein